MDKPEPVIIAGDLSGEELLQWMQSKIHSAQKLKEALSLKEYYQKELLEVTGRIEMLTSQAALPVAASIQPAVISDFFETHQVKQP